MSKHVLDRPRSASTSRLKKFVEIERGDKPSTSSQALQTRVRSPKAPKLAIYTQIERGARH
ncbi:hypothetical protein [Pararhodobacter sp. SW119]|uniref:hypothetical protein n=1 Tax=Pararhodobacter sp. SW119 TaxID=2780075 RepID=UPI001ADF13D4|nr:hypothetical protein [Pararhodobacter sp. SW119]